MDRKQETKLVKDALRAAGIDAQVRHGKGTAWRWLEIKLNSWSYQQYKEALSITTKVTGRHGDYGGRILVK